MKHKRVRGVKETVERAEHLLALVISQLQSRKTLALMLLIMAATLSFGIVARSRISTAASYRDHVSQNDCRDWGTTNLTDGATTTVTTKCQIVEACETGISNNPGATAATYILCNIPSQTATATKGLVYLQAKTAGGTTSGTTAISWGVDGYSTK